MKELRATVDGDTHAVDSVKEADNLSDEAGGEDDVGSDTLTCPEYVERWCAHLRIGTNDIDEIGTDGDSGGIRRWRPLGRFKEIADSMKEERGY